MMEGVPMIEKKIVTNFYIDDHAIIFGFVAKNAILLCGEEGKSATIKGLTAYCRERGLRMAMRCLADGEPLSGKNYILYGEWADARGWSKSEVTATVPNYRTNMVVCGWCDAWKKYGLIEYGKIYCGHADENLVYGFNPELVLRMGSVMSHGDGPCEFDWVSCVFENDAEAYAMESRRAELIPCVTKDFLYHCGHLLSALRREIMLALGLLKGNEIIEKSLADYLAVCGAEKSEALLQESRRNYLEV
jgi:hypothetical protein